jgi:hypothetical protein
MCAAAIAGSVSGLSVPAGRGIVMLPDIPDRQRRDGRPQPVIRGKDAVIPMPVLPRRRHEVRQTIAELKR